MTENKWVAGRVKCEGSSYGCPVVASFQNSKNNVLEKQ